MKTIKIKLIESNSSLPCGHTVDEGCGCDSESPKAAMSHSMPSAHNQEEARMHRTTLAHLMADTKVLLDMIQDGDDLPEWLETKITKAGDYMSSAARYIAGNIARDHGQLEEDILKEVCEINDYFNLYEALQDAVDEDGGTPCPQCLYETIVESHSKGPGMLEEAMYRGSNVTLNDPKRGGSKKFYVYVKGCLSDKKKVKKISFGDPNMKIKKSNPKRRKSFRARHKCATAKDKCTARYWSCKKW